MANKTPGEIAYETWREGRAGDPDALPWALALWSTREAWEAVAEAVRQDLLDAQDIPGEDV